MAKKVFAEFVFFFYNFHRRMTPHLQFKFFLFADKRFFFFQYNEGKSVENIFIHIKKHSIEKSL